MASADATADGHAKGGFSLKSVLIEIVLVSVIAGGAGALLSMLTMPSPSAPSAPTPSASAEKSGAAEGKAGGEGKGGTPNCPTALSLIDLPPIVTNLGAPSDVWIRLEAAIVFDCKSSPHPEVMAAEIATDELAYLRTISVNQLEGPIGLQNIRQDLTDRAVVRSGGKVTEMILKTLVLQ